MTAVRPWIAAQDAIRGQQTSFEESVFTNGFIAVLGAGRMEAANLIA